MGFKITIVGLGIMGGSLAKALRGWRNAEITGIEVDESVLSSALADGVIDRGYIISDENAAEALDADLTVIAIFPRAALEFLHHYAQYAKKGSVWNDLIGIKETIVREAESLMPEGVEFVGAHPMAGKEVYGYVSSDVDLFRGCNYIVTPTPRTSAHAQDLIHEMIRYVGAKHIIETTPERHDTMIAYTSQMAHVLAAAIVNSRLLFESKGFEGGSFHDLTRVGTLNPAMWSELFVMNKEPLCGILKELENHIADMRKLIESDNQDTLRDALTETTARKAEYIGEPFKG